MSTSSPSDIEFLHDFFFRRRQGKLNWRKLAAVDLDRVVADVDIDCLQENVEHITFADLSEEDLYNLSDSNFVQLFRLCQLIIEYLLNVQNFLLFQQKKRDSTIADLKSELESAKIAFSRKDEQIKELKNEVKFQKKVIKAYEKTAARGALVMQAQAQAQAAIVSKPPPATNVYRCEFCRSAFVNESFLESHIERRHKKPEPAPAPAQQATAPAAAPAITLESLESYRTEIERKLREKLLGEMHTRKEFEFSGKLESIDQTLKELKSPRPEEKRQSSVSRLRDEDEMEKTALEIAELKNQQKRDREALEAANRRYEEELERSRREKESFMNALSPRLDDLMSKSQRERETLEREREEERRRREQIEKELRELQERQRLESDFEGRKRLEEQERLKRSEAESAEARAKLLAEEAARQAANRFAHEKLYNAVKKFESGEIVLFADMPYLTSRVSHSADEMRSTIQYFATAANEFSNPIDLADSKLDQLQRDLRQENIGMGNLEGEINELTKKYCVMPQALSDRAKQIELAEAENEKKRPNPFIPSRPLYQPPTVEVKRRFIDPLPPVVEIKTQTQNNIATPIVQPAAMPVYAPVTAPAVSNTIRTPDVAPVSSISSLPPPTVPVSSSDRVESLSSIPTESPLLKPKSNPTESPQFSSVAPTAPASARILNAKTGELELSDEEPDEDEVKTIRQPLTSAIKQSNTTNQPTTATAAVAAPAATKVVQFADPPAVVRNRSDSVLIEDFDDEKINKTSTINPTESKEFAAQLVNKENVSAAANRGFQLRESKEFDGNRSLNFSKPADFFDENEAEVSVDVDDIQEIH